MRLQFFEDKRALYILCLLAFFSITIFFGCTTSKKTSKAQMSEEEKFTIEESGGVEIRDVEPLEDLTMPLSEGTEEFDFERTEDSIGLGEIPSLSYEDDILTERVVVKVENTPLHDVIQSLVRGRGFNLILPEKLIGIVSADFEDISLQDAFDQFLTAYGYTWRLDGIFLRIIKGEPIWIYNPKYIPIYSLRRCTWI